MTSLHSFTVTLHNSPSLDSSQYPKMSRLRSVDGDIYEHYPPLSKVTVDLICQSIRITLAPQRPNSSKSWKAREVPLISCPFCQSVCVYFFVLGGDWAFSILIRFFFAMPFQTAYFFLSKNQAD